MPTKPIRQTRFSLGEVDNTVYKRTDLEDYLAAAQSLENMECGTTQLAKKRRGLRNAVSGYSNVNAYAEVASQMYQFIDKNGAYYLIISATAATGWTVFLADPTTGSLTFYQTITGMPFVSGDLHTIDYALDSDSLELAIGKYAPSRIYVSSYTPTATFSWQSLSTDPLTGLIFPLPAYDFNDVIYNSSTVVFTNPTPSTFLITMSPDPGFAAISGGTPWIGGQVVSFGLTDPRPIGYGIITAMTPLVGAIAITGNVYIPFAAPGDMPTSGSQYAIRKPAWSNTLGWPSCVAFYQNRIWFANTFAQPTFIYGSRINQPINYDVGVGNDTDAIIYNVGQTDTGQILWLNGGKQFEIYTENYEFACPQDPGVGLTPGAFAIRQQSSYGSSRVMKPITYLNDSYFAAKGGGAIVNFHFDGVGLSYSAANISIASQHLISNPINRALQRSETGNQDNFIYFISDPDSTTKTSPITSFQFMGEVKLAAFTPVTFTSNVNVLDVVTVNNRIYFLKQYVASGNFFIEIFDDAFREDLVEQQTAAVFTSGVLGIVTGLGDYEGESVNFFTGDNITGNVQDFGASLDATGQPAPVTGGVAYFDNLSNYTGNIYVGFPYQVTLTPMYLFAGASASNYKKKITNIFVDYVESLDFQIDGYQLPNYTFTPAGPTLVPLTDTVKVPAVDGWERFGTFSITQQSPFDLQVTGIMYQIDAHII